MDNHTAELKLLTPDAIAWINSEYTKLTSALVSLQNLNVNIDSFMLPFNEIKKGIKRERLNPKVLEEIKDVLHSLCCTEIRVVENVGIAFKLELTNKVVSINELATGKIKVLNDASYQHTRKYLKGIEWSMGNGQCPRCYGAPATWAGHPCYPTVESTGHEKNCLIALSLQELGENVEFVGESK